MVQSISEWPCNRELDADVSVSRKFLNERAAKRKSDGDLGQYLNAPGQLKWPDLPTPLEYNVPYEVGRTSDGEVNLVTSVRT